MRLYVLLKKQEESSPFSVGEWVVREASNQDALQEAGTFRYRQAPGGRAVGWVCSLSAEMLLSSQGAPDYLGASCRGFAGRFSTFVC